VTRTERVSVAMATCDGGRFVAEQLASLAGQTRPPDELVVCDDASRDDTRERVAGFAEGVSFDVRVETNASRLGITKNFERAIELCSGDVIFLADQDDYWLPTKIERMLALLRERPEVGAVFCNGRVVDEARRPLGYDLWRAVGFEASEQELARAGRAADVFVRHVVAAGAALAFDARFKALVLPIPGLHSVHDAWLAFLIATVSRVEALDEELIEHRLHADNEFGFRLFDLPAQYRQARVQVAEGAFAKAHAFFSQARDRLAAQSDPQFRATPDTMRSIEEKIDHARRRDDMSPNFFGRLLPVAREIRTGRYRRYSYGWKSVAQDLFLR